MLSITFGLILITTTITCIVLNPKGPIHQNYSTNCIMEIVQHQFIPQHNKAILTILTTSNMSTRAYGVQNKIIKEINHLTNWSLEILNGNQIEFESTTICLNCPIKENDEKEILKNIFQPQYKTHFCLMVTDNFENFLKGLQNYLASAVGSIPGFILVYVSDLTPSYAKLAKDILDTLWDNKIINSAVVIPKNSLKSFNIYGLDALVASKICLEAPRFRLMDICRKGKMDTNWQLFGNKLPKTFHNCSIETIAVEYPPFVINEEDGFEINVLKQLGKILDIKFNLQIKKDAVDWGTQLSKNNWTGPLQDVLESSGIAIGNVKADPDIANDFTLSMDYFYEHMVWVVPISLPIPRWKNIFVIFRYELWLTSIAYFILTAILFQVTSSKDEVESFKKLGINFMTALRILVGIASPEQPKTIMVRTVFMSLCVYSIYVILLYQTLLITFLTNPVYEEQISTIEDIVRSKKGIGGLESYKDYFNVTTDERAMKIYRRFKINEVENDTVYNWIQMVGDYRNTCTISSAFYVNYLLAEYDLAVTTTHGVPKVFVMKEILFTYPVRMVLPKGFPLANQFNIIIGRLVNGGIVKQWAKSYHEHIGKHVMSENEHIDDEDTSITLDHLQGAFGLLVYGKIFGCISFFLELLFYKIGKTKKYKELKRYFRKNPKTKGRRNRKLKTALIKYHGNEAFADPYMKGTCP